MAGKVDDTTLIAGQNEGIERAILPLPQLAFVQNARLRKTGRWGKRWGFGLLPTVGLSASPGNPRCVGPGFAVVDDRCSLFDQTAGSFVQPVTPSLVREDGAASGWLPDRAFFPAPTKSVQHQTATPCATAFASGYLWTVKQIGDPDGTPGAQMLRVVATEIHDQTVVFTQDLRSTLGPAGIVYPRLVVMGSTLALFYLESGILCGRITIGLSGFGAPHIYNGVSLDPVTAYDVSAYDSTSCLFALSVSSTALKTGRIDASLGILVTYTFAYASPITGISIVGSPTTAVYLGWSVPSLSQAWVRVFTMGFSGAYSGDALLTGADGARSLLVLMPNGSARAVYSSKEITATGGLLLGTFSVRDVSPLAVMSPAVSPARQLGAAPISLPFVVGSDVYIWAQILLQQPVTGGGGFPVLLRIDPYIFPQPWTSLPIEMSVQDFVTATGSGRRVTDLQGLPAVSRIGSTATWAALIPILYRSPVTAADILVDFRAVQVTHYTDAPERRGFSSFLCDNSHLIPMGALTRVDAHGPVEVGFVHAPAIAPPLGAAGGGLTASKTYYYSAVFTSRNETGRLEISAPATPAKVALTAAQNSATLSISALYLSGRKNAQLEIYRTLGDGQTFYLVATLSAGGAGGDQITYTDLLADTTISVNPVIYTQIGQQLANGFPPAARFGCTGGARAYLGGLLRGDVAVASKLIVGDQSATFTESDAFKIIVPADLTGIAWMDSLVTFTAEGIYVSTGEGPTDDGVGDFGTASRLPFQIGCIEPRSVITVDEGTFFQSNRGLYLLPRGFGAPVAAGDVVMTTLATFPIITGVAAMVKRTEQTVRWTCVNSAGQGRQIVYDLVHKAWSIDRSATGVSTAAMCTGPWLHNEVASATSAIADAIRVTNDTYGDTGLPIAMTLQTGDIRPFGVQSRGPVQRFGVLTELRSPCTLQVRRITDRGGNPTQRVFSGVIPDDQIGTNNYTQVDLGPIELRSIASLQIELTEESNSEGLAFIALSIERGTSDGLRLEKPADRIV
jgi:hypothetical protein